MIVMIVMIDLVGESLRNLPSGPVLHSLPAKLGLVHFTLKRFGGLVTEIQSPNKNKKKIEKYGLKK